MFIRRILLSNLYKSDCEASQFDFMVNAGVHEKNDDISGPEAVVCMSAKTQVNAPADPDGQSRP